MTVDALSPVSAVLTVYNYGRYLGEALDSVLGQTRPPAEIIVVDDGSTDDTAQVTQAYGPRVRYAYQANAGPGAARNLGVSLAQQPHVAFLDGDDRWELTKLDLQLAALDADPELDLVFAHVQQFLSPDAAGEGEAPQFRVPDAPNAGYYSSTLLARRSAFDRVGQFLAHLKLGEFIDWYARANELGLRSHLLPQVLVWRRIHGANHTLRTRAFRVEYLQVVKAALDRRRAAQKGKD